MFLLYLFFFLGKEILFVAVVGLGGGFILLDFAVGPRFL